MLHKQPVSIVIEMPGELYEVLQGFTESNPNWTEDRAITAALTLFLLQMQGGQNGQGTN
jgi:hypothetical protein